MKDKLKKLARIQRKRLRKSLKRKFVRKVKTRMFTQFGPYVGSQMYRTWRCLRKRRNEKDIAVTEN